MSGGVSGGLIGAIVAVAFFLLKELRGIRRILIALSLKGQRWEGETNGVKFRKTADDGYEALAIDGYRHFDTTKKFERFLKKRPDMLGD